VIVVPAILIISGAGEGSGERIRVGSFVLTGVWVGGTFSVGEGALVGSSPEGFSLTPQEESRAEAPKAVMPFKNCLLVIPFGSFSSTISFYLSLKARIA
jgi:hypothetical protein